ncbi:hypothetical protein BDW02DRAFT_581036 [Decorospora gaudefroyi]|uniref:Heterokaryon incompatibility domain-containing protein n=1 Tax=Decorospora gaudefroyi TaxID=184978 RepID=A0A6A5KCJ5_9PLEO|nr:hypothetical protein BDW02DRAFT_581036 [Decorospora gaudefroyi]
MGRIYSEAKEVIAWLGEGPQSVADAVHQIAKAPKAVHKSGWALDQGPRTITQLRASDYWSRAWIVQEYVLAKEVQLWCGTRQVSRSLMQHTIRGLKLSVWHITHADLLDLPEDICELNLAQRPNPEDPSTGPWLHEWSLQEVLENFGGGACTDVRDRVYAMLSLVSPKEMEQFPICVDYSKSPSELLWGQSVSLREVLQLPYDHEKVVEACAIIERILKEY